MIVGEMKSSIDNLWLRFHTGGVSNPMEVIKQITYLLFIKRLDDLELAKEQKANFTGKAVVDPIFSEDQQTLRWSNFKNLEAGVMFELIRTKVFDFIKTLGGKESAFAKYMKNAYLAIPNPVVLEQVVSMISAIPMDNLDTKGDVYEYMLSKLQTSGDNGQFRTPRHITKMMAELMKPTPDDVICDPACGSAGFLVSASEYLRDHYEQAFYDKDFVEFYKNKMFHGCEFDETMISISAMNLMLHGVDNPDLYDKNSLEEDYTVSDRFSLVLANPPFKGSLESSTVAKSLSGIVKTKKTELLFLALMLRIMKTGGRCAVIVPDGVLFGADKAAVGIRRTIIDEHKLDAVISMPSGVFKPYAGVSTAILIFTKTESGGTDKVWFYDMKADGFSLNDKRTPIVDNDIDDIIVRYQNPDGEKNRTRLDQSFFVPVEEIRSNSYDLSINKYKETVYEQKEYDAPEVIMERLEKLDLEIVQVRKELTEMLKSGGGDE
ncbi:type I restriction enzyme M protein [Parabacteroides sp. PFB2-12]|uniref:type I restriction-modification system subunit M n=1 Tax=unclassified Parabacteroides TaxID=2649774 RepID=UPI002473D30D|nr:MULTISPECIES: class I SAM-dependent DNA methyltransferase [unclassified Parabacteroides]MDH6343800.1 type I restriction enzyme M protein [Parabacteroides sp. PM6-13]MDH6391962.1 type I restriction enzyme M protein [Parabacteroides sp. PFB2-12]